MPNKITYTVQTANTTKTVEYWNPYTQTYQDANPLVGIPAGSYSGLKARLKGSNPAIVATYIGSITVTDAATNTTVNSFNPQSGSVQQIVYINGNGFGPIKGGSTASIGGVIATVTNWSATSVAVLIPKSLTAGLYSVSLIIDGTTYTASAYLKVTVAAQLTLDNVLDGGTGARHLTVGGEEPPTIVAGPISGRSAYAFNGVTNLVREGEQFLPATTETIRFRFKRDATKLGITQVFFGIWGDAKPDTGKWQNQQRLLYFDTSNKLNYLQQIGTSTTSFATLTSGAISDNNWHYAAIVKGGGNATLYIDGQSVSTSACGAAPATVTKPFFRIGAHDDTYVRWSS